MRMGLTVVAAAVLLLSAPADAQIGYLWTPGELFAKADLVVIAEVAETRDTGRRQSHPGLAPGLPVIEMEATLRVLATLKPQRPESTVSDPPSLTLTYFRRDWERWQRENPAAPGAPPPGLVNAGSQLLLEASRTRYLFFLSLTPQGKYEPLSGHTFPTNSVLRLCEATGRSC